MAHCRTSEEKKKLITRLKRLEGQMRGLQKMIDADAECIDILRQINSASGALHGVWLEVLSAHMKGCISNALAHKDTKLVDELIEHLRKVS